jgi:HK97 family phage major capsid protein
MNRLKQLRAQRAALAKAAKAATEAALKRLEAEGGDLTDDETKAQADFDAQLASIDAQIRLAERSIEIDAGSVAAAPPVLDAGPVAPQIEVGASGVARDPFRGFRIGAGADAHFDMGQFALVVRAACRPGGSVDHRLIEGGLLPGGAAPQAAPTNYHQETGTAEGAMLPPVVSQSIWQLVFEDPLLGLLTVEPTMGSVVETLADETTPWGATGVVAKWRSEGVQMTPSKLDTKMKQTRLHELYAFVLATEELLEDAPRLADRLNVKAPAAIRWKLVESFMFGTGAGQPLGWAVDNYSGRVTVPRAVASQIAPADAAKMFSRLLVTDGPDRSFWVANRDTFPELVVRMTVGNQSVWLPPTGIQGAPGGTLFGRPLHFSEHCQTLGTEADLQYVNPDGYYATQRGAARQDVSIHLYFDYAITAFRWMFRFGGQPLLSAAVAAAKGSNTKSHFVILTDAA